MVISHTDAISLENIVRKVFQCDRYGVGGFADADVLENNPFEAAVLCIAAVYHNHHDDEIAEFCRKWRFVFKNPSEEQEYTMENYIHELKELIELVEQ